MATVPTLTPMWPSNIVATVTMVTQSSCDSLSMRMEATKKESELLQEKSRELLSLSYLTISKLHRGNKAEANVLLAKADTLYSNDILPIIHAFDCSDGSRSAFLHRSRCENSLQIYLTARMFSSFLSNGILDVPSYSSNFGSTYEWHINYLMAIMLTIKELERYSILRAQELDEYSVQLCLEVVQSAEKCLLEFNFRNGILRKKFDGVKYTVRKLEDILYEIGMARERATDMAHVERISKRNIHLITPSSSEKESLINSPSIRPSKKQRIAKEDEISKETVNKSTLITSQLNDNAIKAVQLRYDAHDAYREKLIKESRVVQKLSKNAIFSLHRGKVNDAMKQLSSAVTTMKDIMAYCEKEPSLRNSGSFTSCIEEYCEAVLFHNFLQPNSNHILSCSEIEKSLPLKITPKEYLGGCLDLTGEVGRVAVRLAGKRDKKGVQNCLALVDAIKSFIQILPMPGGIGKKMGALRATQSKLENVLYEMALVSSGKSAMVKVSATPFEVSTDE